MEYITLKIDFIVEKHQHCLQICKLEVFGRQWDHQVRTFMYVYINVQLCLLFNLLCCLSLVSITSYARFVQEINPAWHRIKPNQRYRIKWWKSHHLIIKLWSTICTRFVLITLYPYYMFLLLLILQNFCKSSCPINFSCVSRRYKKH